MGTLILDTCNNPLQSHSLMVRARPNPTAGAGDQVRFYGHPLRHGPEVPERDGDVGAGHINRVAPDTWA